MQPVKATTSAHSSHHAFVTRLAFFTCVIVALANWLTPLHRVLASTQSEEGDVTVSASIADNAAPTTPILISPNNGSYVTTSKPTFVWRESTDANGIARYELSLDGSTLFGSIPTTPTENDDYILTYDNVSNEYSLTVKDNLSQGTHTWKIRAVDALGNGSDSATWSFTIDTQAPNFVITSIGDAVVTISAQDASTIPSSPIELNDNEPLIIGNGEANSTVQTTLTIPGDPTQQFTNTIASNGVWGLQLGTLPRDVVMILDFVITDQANHVSVLSSVQFIILSDTIVFPPASPSPTPSPVASPSPGASPEPSPTPGATPPLSPSPTPPSSPGPSPIIEVTYIPPDEILNEIIQETGELLLPIITTIRSVLPPQAVTTLDQAGDLLAPVSALALAGFIPLAAAVGIATYFGGTLSLTLLIRLLQAFGLLPAGRPQGLVFNSITGKPVAFALLTITTTDPGKPVLSETVITNPEGVFKGVALSKGTYRISVSHQDFLFPSLRPRPSYLNADEFYQGQEFTITTTKDMPTFLIPMDPIAGKEEKASQSLYWQLLLVRLAKMPAALAVPLCIISGILTFIFPTIWNWLVFVAYLALLTGRAGAELRRPTIHGQVVDTKGAPIRDVVIRITEVASNHSAAVLITDENGSFAYYGDSDLYQLAISKIGYLWVDESIQTITLHEVDARARGQYLVATMKQV